MEGLASSNQQRGNVEGKHEKGLGDVTGTHAGPGLTSSNGRQQQGWKKMFVVPSYSLLLVFLFGWLAGWLVGLLVDSRLRTTLSTFQAGDRGG